MRNRPASYPLVERRLPLEGVVFHGRNSQIKELLYYTVVPAGKGAISHCVNLNSHGMPKKGNWVALDESYKCFGRPDVWCFEKQPDHFADGLLSDDEQAFGAENKELVDDRDTL